MFVAETQTWKLIRLHRILVYVYSVESSYSVMIHSFRFFPHRDLIEKLP